jgi:hypothetical protein
MFPRSRARPRNHPATRTASCWSETRTRWRLDRTLALSKAPPHGSARSRFAPISRQMHGVAARAG